MSDKNDLLALADMFLRRSQAAAVARAKLGSRASDFHLLAGREDAWRDAAQMVRDMANGWRPTEVLTKIGHHNHVIECK